MGCQIALRGVLNSKADILANNCSYIPIILIVMHNYKTTSIETPCNCQRKNVRSLLLNRFCLRLCILAMNCNNMPFIL